MLGIDVLTRAEPTRMAVVHRTVDRVGALAGGAGDDRGRQVVAVRDRDGVAGGEDERWIERGARAAAVTGREWLLGSHARAMPNERRIGGQGRRRVRLEHQEERVTI